MKRAAEKQLTRDDVDDEPDSEITDATAPFQRAAPEVLAKRRILKARRTIAPSTQAAPDKPNPFAALRPVEPEPVSQPAPTTASKPAPPPAEVPSTEPTQPAPPAPKPDQAEAPSASDKNEQPPKPPSTESAQPQPAVKQPQSPAEQAPEKNTEQPKDKLTEQLATEPVKPAAEAATETAVPNKPAEPPKPAEQAKPHEPAKPAEPPKPTESAKPDSKSDASKPQTAPSGDQPAHGENEKDSANGNPQPAPPTEQPTAPESSADPKPASNATNGTKPAIIFGGASAINTVSFATAAKTDNAFNFKTSDVKSPAAKATNHVFKEQPVTSGEEDETNLFRTRAKLYSLEGEQGKQRWRERGVGALKMNEHNETHNVRLLMRSEGVFRVILNTPLYARIKLDRATERSIRFQGFEQQDAKCYLLRFATRDATSEFVAAVDKWKKSAQQE